MTSSRWRHWLAPDVSSVHVTDAVLSRVPRLFVILGAALGVPYALIMGPLRVPDESGHFYRAYTTSRGTCIGVPAVAAPADWRNLANETIWTPLPPNTTAPEVVRLIKLPQDAQGGVGLFTVANLYSCVPYLASGIAMRAASWAGRSMLIQMYLGRLANLAVYLALIYFALTLLPKFGLILAGLALMPMALHQAASLSSDSLSIAFAFLWIAFVLRLSLDPGRKVRPVPEQLLLFSAIVLGALMKANVGLVLATLLIPTSRFASRRARALWVAAYIVVSYGTAAAWQSLTRGNWEIVAAVRNAAGIGITDNARFIFHHPLLWLATVARSVAYFNTEYLEEFVGKLGWLTIRLPLWVVWIFAALLLAAAVTQGAGNRFSRSQRFLLAGIFLLNLGTLFAAVWSIEMPREYLFTQIAAGRGVLSGIQGRYLIPFAPLLLIAVSGRAPLRAARLVAPALLTFALAANVVALRLAWNTYQSRTSTLANRVSMALHLLFTDAPETAALRFDRRLVRRPGPLPQDQQVYFVSAGVRHLLSDSAWLSRNGYRWPDDVLIIPAAALDSIPLGDPLATPAAAMLWVHDSREANVQADGPRILRDSTPNTFHLRFIATATRTIRIHLHVKPGSGAVVWSQVRLSSSAPAPPIRNADFADGTLAPWMYYGALKWKLTTAGTFPVGLEEQGGDGGVCQDITGLTPGAIYDVTATARYLLNPSPPSTPR